MIYERALPPTWTLASLAEAADINPRGFSPLSQADKLPAHFVGMAAVKENFAGIDISITRPLSQIVKGYTPFLSGDVLFAKITPCMENGKGGLVPDLPMQVGFGSTEFHVLRTRGAALPEWFAHFLSQLGFRRVARQNMTGSAGQLRVPTNWLEGTSIPLAPLDEQKRIVEKLDELFTELDAGVAELQAAQKKLAQYRKSLLKAAVEGALTADWRAAHPPQESGEALLARILRERRTRWETRQLDKFTAQGKTPPKGWQSKYVEAASPDTKGLPQLPAQWGWASAEQLCDFITKGTTPPKYLGDGDDKTVPFIRVTNLTATGALDMRDKVFVSDAVHRGFLARSVVFPADVLMNIVGPPLGQVSVVPNIFPEWNINQAIAIFRPVAGVLNSYLANALLSPLIQQWLNKRAKTTAGQTNLTLELCRALPIPLPPESEQVELARQVNASIEALGELVSSNDLGLKQAAAQRQNILRAAFAGQLVPQDPADEPASALLARIRAERATTVAAPKTTRRTRVSA